MIFCLPALLILMAAGLAASGADVAERGDCSRLVLMLSARMIPFVYSHDFEDERDGRPVAAEFILDHAQPGDAVIFHIAATRIPYEFEQSELLRTEFSQSKVWRTGRETKNAASAGLASQPGPEILFPHHGAELDYRDFTGKPTADFVGRLDGRSAGVDYVDEQRAGGNPDATTVMLAKILPETFPRMTSWQFPKVAVLLYSQQVQRCARQTQACPIECPKTEVSAKEKPPCARRAKEAEIPNQPLDLG